jgi:alpha-N-arabinofuranosidase
MVVTPTAYVYELYAPHQGATAVRSMVETDSITFKKGEKEGSLPAIAGSASLKEKTLFISLTNSHADKPVDVKINLLGGASAATATARILTGEIHAHNRFDQPDAIQPQPFAVQVAGSSFTLTLPAASILALEIGLS